MVNDAATPPYAFHCTVRGASHIGRGAPCEDASAAYSDPDGAFHILAVSDGHGDSRCFRSRTGAELAVELAVEVLQAAARDTLALPDPERQRFFHDMVSNPRYCRLTFARWSDAILTRWNERLRQDYADHPPTDAELDGLPPRLRAPEYIPHIYGATLIAALYLPPALLLFQQGDGRCDVFYADGSVNQPIPWDPNCEGNITTSLCDPDAAEEFRSCIINLDETPIMACYLGSDGVEDAYRDTYADLGGSHGLMNGVHMFYKALNCEAAERTPEEMSEYLSEWLPGFSRLGQFGYGGSWDDVSVSGLVFPERIAPFTAPYRRDVTRYRLEEDLFWREDTLRSGARKHEVLRKRRDEARARLDAAREEIKRSKASLANLETLYGQRQTEFDSAQAAFVAYDTDYQAVRAERDKIQEELSALASATDPRPGTESEDYNGSDCTVSEVSGEQTALRDENAENEQRRLDADMGVSNQ